MCVGGTLWGMRGGGGEHGVQCKFINKGLKKAVKLLGKLFYLARPIKEDYLVWLLKLSVIVN